MICQRKPNSYAQASVNFLCEFHEGGKCVGAISERKPASLNPMYYLVLCIHTHMYVSVYICMYACTYVCNVYTYI